MANQEESEMRNIPPFRSCPEPSVWASFSTGQIAATKDAESLLAHAAECLPCGLLLKEALAVFAKDPDPEEKEFLGRLASSQEDWQRRVGGELAVVARSSQAKTASPRNRIRWLLWAASVAAVLAVGAVGLWLYRANHSVDRLLARAYDQRRLTELRIPEGMPVALYSPVRGAGTAEPPDMLEARLMAERGLEKDPTSPQWHQVLGRIDVVAMEPASALAQFQIAEVRDPHLARIQFDLGTAWFELGESSGDTSNYGYAAERFSRFLNAVNGRDTVALYDRALCWERTGVLDLARRDLSAAIVAESNRDWRRAMEQKLRTLDRPAVSGAASKAESESLAPGMLDDYEEQLTSALTRNLSHPSAETLAEFQRIASIGESHHDFWVADWLAASERRPSAQGDAALAAAIAENQSGNSARGLDDSLAAQRFYRIAGNTAGQLRAASEEVYALRRTGRPQDCLQKITPLLRADQDLRYLHMHASSLLDRAVCLAMVGQFENARSDAQAGISLARSAGFPVLEARATGFLAGFYSEQGLVEQGWNRDTTGLLNAGLPMLPPMGRYQFLDDMTLDAGTLGLTEVAAQLAAESARIAATTGNLQIAAYATELLGQRDTVAGKPGDAAQAFAQADSVLGQLGNSNAAQLYRADWSADRAELDLHQGQPDVAARQLDKALPMVERSHDLFIELNYWTRRAQIEGAEGHWDSSLASATKATEYAETTFAGLRTSDERRAWQQNTRSAWLALVDSLLEEQKPTDALNAWLHFRSAPELPSVAPGSSASAGPLPGLGAPSVSEVVIYIRLPDRYVALRPASSGNQVRVVPLRVNPDSLDQMVRTFSLLCANPRSPPADLASLGGQLYSILIAPLEPLPAELRIDTSGALDRLPFAALVASDGSYLASRIPVVRLPDFWALRPPQDTPPVTARDRLMLVDAPRDADQNLTAIPQRYDESESLASRFPHLTRVATGDRMAQRLVGQLASSDIFHFVGHSVSQSSSAGLLLGSSPDDAAALLTPSTLEGKSLPHCRLVVLAACSTMGEEPRPLDEPFALPAAFLRAGANDVLATRWNVDSAATKSLVIAFYDELLKGKSPAVALMSAQAVVRGIAPYRHPYYWASFSLFEQ
ncbi:MAG: CHAT domain-containing protein [Acidobacteriaceae bacterium]